MGVMVPVQCSVYLHLPHLLLKVVQLFLETSSNLETSSLETSSNSDIDLQKEQFKDQSNSEQFKAACNPNSRSRSSFTRPCRWVT